MHTVCGVCFGDFCFIFYQPPGDHLAYLITVGTALIIFIVMYFLVYFEYFFWCRLKLFAVVIWICLLAIGYVSVFAAGKTPQLAAWEQVF